MNGTLIAWVGESIHVPAIFHQSYLGRLSKRHVNIHSVKHVPVANTAESVTVIPLSLGRGQPTKGNMDSCCK